MPKSVLRHLNRFDNEMNFRVKFLVDSRTICKVSARSKLNLRQLCDFAACKIIISRDVFGFCKMEWQSVPFDKLECHLSLYNTVSTMLLQNECLHVIHMKEMEFHIAFTVECVKRTIKWILLFFVGFCSL
jgi:hypothetical protein